VAASDTNQRMSAAAAALASELERVLARLLGPAAPEIACDECFDLLDHQS
jgi:hypothetical protein